MKALKRFITVITVTAMMIGLVMIIGAVASRKDRVPQDLIASEDPSGAAEKKALEKMKHKKSDLKGRTMYEKYMMGLNPAKGSDTDGDGLTDKEEIEEYGTDPLKMSTSGDLYTDGEKVGKGLSPDEKHDYEGAVKYKGNHSDGIIRLSAKTAEGRFATVTDMTGMDSLKGHDIYKEYVISHFDGTIKVDASKMSGIDDAKDLAVYIEEGNGGKAKAAKTDTDGDIISVDHDFDLSIATVYIVKGSAINLPAGSRYSAQIPDFGSDGFDGIVYSFPLVDFISGEAHILYLDTDDKETVRNEKEMLVAMANSDDGIGAQMDTKSDRIKAASASKIKSTYSFFKKVFPFGEVTGKGNDALKFLFSYARLKDGKEILSADEKSYLNRDIVDSGFDVKKDAFPFHNLSEEKLAPGGVCSGYSTVTSMVYNNGKPEMLSADGIRLDDGTLGYSWDISGKAFKDLKTRGRLHSFKDSGYINSHEDKDGYFSKDLSSDDRTFLNLMVYYNTKSNNANNDVIPKSVYYFANNTNYYRFNDRGYSYDTIKWIKKQIKKGKIVNVGMTMGCDASSKAYRDQNALKGHMICLTEYEDYGNGKTVFKVYDCNMPDRDDLYMTVQKVDISKNYMHDLYVEGADGGYAGARKEGGKKQYSFYYKYAPVEGNNDYVMTNLKNGKYWFDVIDTSEKKFVDRAVVNK